MLERIAAIHHDLADWRRQAHSKAAAYKPFCTMLPLIEELEAILYKGRHFTRGSRELIPHLGYSAHAWNGLDEPRGLQFAVDVGGYSPGHIYPNVVDFEGLQPNNRGLVRGAVLERVLLASADSWDADWGTVETWAYNGKTVNANQQWLAPWGGWLTYLSHDLASKVSPPSGIQTRRLTDGSLVMTVCDEPFDVANPLHASRLDAVQKALAPVQLDPTEAFRAAFPSTGV
jgi:hypothetical protein